METPVRTSFGQRLRRGLRVIVPLLLLLALVAVASLLKIASSGVPRWVLDMVAQDISGDGRCLEIGNLRIMPSGNAFIDSLRLFQPGEADPATELRHVQVSFHWSRHGNFGLADVESILVDQAIVRSLNLPAIGGGTDDKPRPAGPISLVCKRLDLLGVPVTRVRAALSRDAEAYRITKFSADFAQDERIGGEISVEPAPAAGDVPSSPRIVGNLVGSLIPSRLNPALRKLGLESLPDIFADFSAPDTPPRASARFDVSGTNRVVRVKIDAERLLYHDVGTLRASAEVIAFGDADDWNGVRVRNLSVIRPEGTANADLLFDFRRHGVGIKATSTLDFPNLARLIGILSFIPWDTYETAGGNRATAEGFYAFSEATEPSDLRGTLSAGSFSFRRRTPARDVSAVFAIQGDEYRFTEIRGRLYDGDCDSSATLRYDESGDMLADLSLNLTSASTRLFSQDIFHMDIPDDPGRADLRASATLNVSTNTLRSITGSVKGKVRDSRLYQTPLFAGFTDFMARNVPGIDFLVNQDDLDLEADISDNGMHFTTLRIEGALFSISGEGDYWFTDYLDLGVKVSLLKHRTWIGKVLKVALYPVSKLFELEVRGPLAEAVWSPTTLALSGRTRVTDEQKYGPAPESVPLDNAEEAAP